MNTVKEATDTSFEATVLKSDKPVLVDFWAPWCMPCRMMGPVLEEVAGKNVGKVDVVKVNTDESRRTAAQFGIHSIPSLVFFKNGKEVHRMIGSNSAKALQTVLDKLA